MYRIAIPSYKRASSICQKTIRLLKDWGFPPEQIDIFVVEEEVESYKLYLEADKYYNSLIVGVRGLAEQRFFIQNYYPADTNILFADDDLERFKVLPSVTNLPQTCSKMFELTRSQGCHLWGIYPIANTLFQKERVVKGAVYCVGAFFGYINERQLQPPTSEKEDIFNTCYYVKKDGAVLRLESVGVQTRYFKNTGGLQTERTKESIRLAAEAVFLAYTDLLNPPVLKKKGKKDEYWDCKFKKSSKQIITL